MPEFEHQQPPEVITQVAATMQVAPLVYCVQRFFTFGDLAQDALNRRTPDEYLGLLVVVFNVILDGGDQFLEGVKATSPDALLGPITKPTFGQVQLKSWKSG